MCYQALENHDINWRMLKALHFFLPSRFHVTIFASENLLAPEFNTGR